MSSQLPKIWPEKQRLTDSEFRKLSNFITSNYGIKLPAAKKVMVEGRLQKRLKATATNSFKEYLELVFSGVGNYEMLEMIDAISTNKTDFFREPGHFDFLSNVILPELKSHKLKIWSAASSTGEEIYTLAIVLEEHNSKPSELPVDYHILGTDISVEALKKAVLGVYTAERIRYIPIPIRNKYFLRSKDRAVNRVRVMPRLRAKTSFSRLNLVSDDYPINEEKDIIFCRNVLIYFDKETQERVINKLCDKLKIGGYFFLGHSESILGKNVPLKQVIPTVYKRV